MKRILLYLIIFVLILVGVIAGAFRFEPFQQKVIAYVIKQVEDRSGMIVEVTNPLASFPLRFQADHIHLHYPNQTGLEIDMLQLRISVFSLLRNKLSFSKLFAEKVVLPDSKQANSSISWETFPSYLRIKNLEVKQLVLNSSLTQFLRLDNPNIYIRGYFLIDPSNKFLDAECDVKEFQGPINPTHFAISLNEENDNLELTTSVAETDNGKFSNSAKLPSNYSYNTLLQLSGKKEIWSQFVKNEKSENSLKGFFQVDCASTNPKTINPILGLSSYLKGDLSLSTDQKLDSPNIVGSLSEIPLKGAIYLSSDHTFKNSKLQFDTETLSFPTELNLSAEKVVGTIALEGNALAPTFKVELNTPIIHLQDSKIENLSLISNFGFAPDAIQGNVSTHFQYQDSKLSGNAFFEWNNSTLYLTNFSGTNGFGQGLGDLALSFQDNALNISSKGRIETLLEQFASTTSLPLTGDAKITLQLSGSLEEPKIKGSIAIENGNMELLQIASSIKNLKILAAIEDKSIKINEIAGIDNHGGSIKGNGMMEIDVSQGMPLTLDLKLEKFTTSPFYYTTMVATGDLHFNANLHGGSLSGKVITDKVDITFPDETEEHPYAYPVTYINHPENARLPTTAKSKTFIWPVTINLDVEVPSKGFINGQHWNSEWEGAFKVGGTLDAISLLGTCTIKKGEYRFNGNAFQIDEGTITFAGDPYKKTTLYVIASRELDEIKAEIILKGSLKNPAISFRSNPPLPQREILSWILFNTGSSEITPFQGTQLNQSITNLNYSSGKPDMLTRIRNQIGIDRIDISRDDNGGANIQVGKYISRGIFVSVNKSVTSETNRVAVEAKVMKNVKVQAEVGDDSEAELMLKWKHDY